MSEQQINFGITKETRSEGTKLFNPPTKLEKPTDQFPNGYKFPNGVLVNVVPDPKKETKNGEQEVIQFIFKGSKGEVYTHTEWSIDVTDDKFNTKLDSLNSRIKHILEQVGLKMPEAGIGVNAKNFAEFFQDVADTFNNQVIEEPSDKEGEAPKKIKKYFLQRVYLKLTYYKKNLSFPMFPDFIQKATDKDGKTAVCNLAINPSYDNLEPDSSGGASFTNVAGGGGDLGDLPDFD